MKKIFIFIIMAFMVLIPTINVEAKEDDKVTIHVFYAEWCGNCTNLHNFLNELEEDKEYNDMFEVKYYRIDNDDSYGKNTKYDANKKLYNKVKAYFEYDEGYIPFYIIGDKYDVGFSTTSTPAEIKNSIRENFFSKKYKNVVQEIIDKKIDVSEPVTTKSKGEESTKKDSNNTRKEETEIEKKESKNTKTIGIIIMVITLVVVVAAIVFSMIKK